MFMMFAWARQSWRIITCPSWLNELFSCQRARSRNHRQSVHAFHCNGHWCPQRYHTESEIVTRHIVTRHHDQDEGLHETRHSNVRYVMIHWEFCIRIFWRSWNEINVWRVKFAYIPFSIDIDSMTFLLFWIQSVYVGFNKESEISRHDSFCSMRTIFYVNPLILSDHIRSIVT